MEVLLVENTNRTIVTASLLEDRIGLSFADGLRGLIPYTGVPEAKPREGISSLELPNPYVMVLQIAGGGWVKVSWGLRPALLRRIIPANHRSLSCPREAYQRRTGPAGSGSPPG